MTTAAATAAAAGSPIRISIIQRSMRKKGEKEGKHIAPILFARTRILIQYKWTWSRRTGRDEKSKPFFPSSFSWFDVVRLLYCIEFELDAPRYVRSDKKADEQKKINLLSFVRRECAFQFCIVHVRENHPTMEETRASIGNLRCFILCVCVCCCCRFPVCFHLNENLSLVALHTFIRVVCDLSKCQPAAKECSSTRFT